ncbi:prolyl hydroxylase family protein [Phenylobacterium sp.]|uniref:prolyl hydroxylase family protein n=1 Tax=Phenylobacterium sp. TaxID=1871053 RepID=UPI0035AE68EA
MSPEDLAEVRRRAGADDPQALAMAAVLAGLGAGEPQSWPAAIQRLTRAAELGLESARGQLAVLANAAPDAGADWTGLARTIDMGRWLAPPPKERLSRDPRISRSPGFLAPQVCDWLIERARGRVTQAKVFDPAGDGGRTEAGRTNSAFELALEDLDLVTVMARTRIAVAVGVPPGALEPIQVLHYAPGQRFTRHFDYLDPTVPGYAADVARRGQRMATFLVYLNAEFEGGETDFPLVGLKFKGAPGEALMFANVDMTGAPDRRTLHEGLPPASGEKWLLSQWIRDRAAA